MASEKRIALPIMTHPGIEYIGKTVREAVTDGEVHFAATKALAERFPSAASTVIMDLTVEAEATVSRDAVEILPIDGDAVRVCTPAYADRLSGKEQS